VSARALPRGFFERPVVELAEALIGRLVVRRAGQRVLVGRIVETEAYGGQGIDPSAHSYKGPTPRCEVMFGPAGRAYVYATQGRCFCLNVSAEGDAVGKAVLIRAAEPLAGVATMLKRRLARLEAGPTRTRLAAGRRHELAAGPGRLCICLDIDRRLNGTDLTREGSSLFLAEDPDEISPLPRVRWTPRVGLNRKSASFGWRWRAIDADSPAVSGPRAESGRHAQPDPRQCPHGPA
jgi:DNA-3-methyladenine glycosylase